ncbi:MAG: carboxymuconolactone decarboxylase family protein [SAR202 cluster bacterium]|nr:carboxymuconolactone decarboxylase family protein [SAR202 cluster bacterium]MDP6512527.1 carboxymuconolactone decarboxylase family protein [SAR202 cluster bacterium]MDP6714320.1 carboxymuconolactone decarboxylase family protein [SAR202 cluster bacterium]
MDQDSKQNSEIKDDCLQGDELGILAVPTKALVEIGAAAALNCHTCLHHLIPAALNNGILAEEVSAALAVAGEIRTRAAAVTDSLGATLVNRNERHPNGNIPDEICG